MLASFHAGFAVIDGLVLVACLVLALLISLRPRKDPPDGR